MAISITYLVLVHGEEQGLALIDLLAKHKDAQDKIVVLNDPTTDEYTKKLKQKPVKVVNHKLEYSYSEHRNYALQYCHTDYIFALDADEVPSLKLLQNIKPIIANTNNPDVIWLPRLNLFNGVLPIHALIYNWTLQGNIVNWPDLQTRLFKNRKGIKWKGNLHERLDYDDKTHKVVQLPPHPDFIIEHKKEITKQLKDNEYYNLTYSESENRGLII